MSDQTRPKATAVSSGVPRVFPISSLVPRANSPESRSARVVNADTTGAQWLFAGMFWSDPTGGAAGWSFGDTDPHVEGSPWVGVGEEVYLCLRGRVAVEWEGGSFEFGAGDIVYWPNNRWFRTRIIGDEPVQVFYVMAPPPTSMWGLGDPVTITGEPVD